MIPTAAVRVAVKVIAAAAAALLMRRMSHGGGREKDVRGGSVIRIGGAMILKDDLRREGMTDVEETRSGAERGIRKMTPRYHPAQARHPSAS